MAPPHIVSIAFSQSGQTSQVEEVVLGPLLESGVSISQIRLVEQNPYPFPWPVLTLLNAIPETILLQPPPNEPVAPPAAEADIVLLLASMVSVTVMPCNCVFAITASKSLTRWKAGGIRCCLPGYMVFGIRDSDRACQGGRRVSDRPCDN
jgi:hypothetical protein